MLKPWPLAARTSALAFTATVMMGAAQQADNVPNSPLQGPKGVTALSGQVVDMKGNGLIGVEMSVGTSRTRSDDQGRFLLTYVIPGTTVLQIDGRHASANKNVDYGYYEARVEALPGRTTVLPFKSWLPAIDHSHDVTIASPTRSTVVVRTPSIPDLELRIPAGVVIRDSDGKIVKHIGITALSPDHTPVPLPQDLDIPTYFTIQPGASCLYDAAGGIGTATIAYPNYHKELPKARAMMWRYEPDANGWTSYGIGTVSSDGRQIVPDPGVVLTDFDSGNCDPTRNTHKPPPERPRLMRQLGGAQ